MTGISKHVEGTHTDVKEDRIVQYLYFTVSCWVQKR